MCICKCISSPRHIHKLIKIEQVLHKQMELVHTAGLSFLDHNWTNQAEAQKIVMPNKSAHKEPKISTDTMKLEVIVYAHINRGSC